MVKLKSKTTKKPTTVQKKLHSKQQAAAAPADFDSMIENESSEEESTENVKQESSDDGFSEAEPEADQPKANKRKVTENTKTVANKKPKKFEKTERPPTLEEVNELKETRNLYHSNLFRLQIKEMLTELKIKEKYTNHITKWLTTFRTFVQALENDAEKQPIENVAWLKRAQNLAVPLTLSGIDEPKRTFHFQFIKPEVSPFLIGAAATNTLLGPKLVADVCVIMPAACFQKDNYLNLIYDQKRAYYLSYLVHKMRAAKEFAEETFAFAYQANNPLKPVLELTPAGNLANKLCIRLHVAASETSFKLSRFVPWTNNIRATLYGDELSEDVAAPTTPHYNAGVLHDLTLQRNQELLNEIFEGKQNLQQGLLLLKVWLRQRQLNVGYSGFTAHILAMYIVYLFKQRKLHANMSSYQVARNVWNQLASSTWEQESKGITLANSNEQANNQPTLEHFHDYYEVVFVDVTGFYNICANLPLEMYERVRQEAKLAVDMLNDTHVNSFQALFMSKVPLYTQFDHILKINKPDAVEQLLELHVAPADKYNNANYAYPQLLKTVKSLLCKGLQKRITTLLPIEQTTESWSIDTPAPVIGRHLHLGIILNPEHAFEVLERGPESIAPEAVEFRKFWGDKAQLRRFQDGSIIESVVWGATTDNLSKKRLIVRTIVLHLLQQHFQLEPEDITYIGGDFDKLYQLTPAFRVPKFHNQVTITQDTDAEAMAPLVIHCFDELARQLHDLRDLPVEIVSIAGTSAIFKYCEPEPVLPEARISEGQFFASHVHRAIIQLGQIGNWPNELAALRAMKTGFHIQIAQLLREKYKLKTQVTYDGVLVYKKGYCFCIELAHPKEVALLKKEKKGLITQYVHCEASIALERKYYVMPKVTSALRSLYQTQPCFGPTVMLAKRWLASQLIHSLLWPDEATELLVASLFLRTQAPQQTIAPQTGFIRFLQLLANTDWQSELFLLNFNNTLDETQLSDLEQRFRNARDTFPPLTIATSYDLEHYGQLWTKTTQPSINVLARVTILARQSLSIVETSLLSTTESFLNPKRLFGASHLGYDLVIQLKPESLRNALCFDLGSPFAALSKPHWRLPLAGSNYLRDAVQQLMEAYGDFAAFFYNQYGGKEIGIVWKPKQYFEPKDFKVNEVNACTLSLTEADKVQCLKETLIEDFKIILKDYYLRIDTVQNVLRESRASKRYYEEKRQEEEANVVPKKMSKQTEAVVVPKKDLKLGNVNVKKFKNAPAKSKNIKSNGLVQKPKHKQATKLQHVKRKKEKHVKN